MSRRGGTRRGRWSSRPSADWRQADKGRRPSGARRCGSTDQTRWPPVQAELWMKTSGLPQAPGQTMGQGMLWVPGEGLDDEQERTGGGLEDEVRVLTDVEATHGVEGGPAGRGERAFPGEGGPA